MRRLIQRFMDLAIAWKLAVFIYAVVLLLFTVLTLVLLNLAQRTSREELMNSAFSLCKSGNQLIEKERSYLMGVADYYSISPEIQALLTQSNLGQDPALSEEMLQGVRAHSYVLSLVFYNLSGQPVDYIAIDASHSPLPQRWAWGDRPFQRLVSRQSVYEWEFIPQSASFFMERDNSPKLCLWRAVKNIRTSQVIGVLAVTVDSRKLLDAYNIQNNLYKQLVLLDATTNGILSNYTGLALSGVDCRMLAEHAPEDSGYFTAEIAGELQHVFYVKPDGTLTTYYLQPDRTFNKHLNTYALYSLVAITLFVILLFPFLLVVTNMVTRPLQKLADSMVAFSEGNFDTRLAFRYHDEIGRLGATFNHMVTQNKSLIEQTYVLRLREQEAELALLQAQINPHFLYNLINSIQWSALRHGEQEIADIAYSMGQVFRLSLNRGNHIIALRQEKDLISYYLKLQKRRYGERVEYTISVEEAVMGVQIPKLIIQPLVENSILHGAENSRKTVHIAVRVFAAGDGVGITVEDDGVGIAPEILSLLPDGLAGSGQGGGSRFALKNISDRLRMVYGPAQRFVIESIPGQGTSIHLLLPRAIPSKKEEDLCLESSS